jgi:hypothetical protein
MQLLNYTHIYTSLIYILFKNERETRNWNSFVKIKITLLFNIYNIIYYYYNNKKKYEIYIFYVN